MRPLIRPQFWLACLIHLVGKPFQLIKYFIPKKGGENEKEKINRKK